MNFENLDVWKRSARLSVNLYRQLTDSRERGFKDQITRSGLSIPSNIAEGMSREGMREKVRFLLIAKGSCAELRTQLYIGREAGFVSEEFAKPSIQETREIAAMLSSLIQTIRND
ncbi:four helix bundle protein [Pseudomonas sp. KSR10]|jgi:four helix bundle protein|uniref:23S ribosomal RNA protein n=1 Tax=Stutzerimonas stutzeri TaxID=316 RepID=A0A0D9AG70_STUST|nr:MULTISPECIES: four helix bundle protein [Pseudomonadaceae]KJH80045.1 23S ribosomal RNA protein [Stutzerimonas stutzeri]MCG6539981.1 four helix bundle protein [Pseudomonas sp. KSR10]